MTSIARQVLAAFDALDPMEKREVLIEVLRRAPANDPLTEQDFDRLGAELFQSYDAEEAAGADR